MRQARNKAEDDVFADPSLMGVIFQTQKKTMPILMLVPKAISTAMAINGLNSHQHA
jgi:hypothetical protein